MEVEGRRLIEGNKKARKINVSSPFSLCSLDGDDRLGTLIDCAMFVRNSKKYRFVLPKILAA
jgi:hypothetical protein